MHSLPPGSASAPQLRHSRSAVMGQSVAFHARLHCMHPGATRTGRGVTGRVATPASWRVAKRAYDCADGGLQPASTESSSRASANGRAPWGLIREARRPRPPTISPRAVDPPAAGAKLCRVGELNGRDGDRGAWGLPSSVRESGSLGPKRRRCADPRCPRRTDARQSIAGGARWYICRWALWVAAGTLDT